MKMVLKSTSAVKAGDAYTWYEYTGNSKMPLERRGKTTELKGGDLFGVRPSSNGKAQRLVVKSLGDTIVFTLDATDMAFLMKRSKAAGKAAQSADTFKMASDALYGALSKAPAFTFNMGLVKKYRALAKKIDAIASKDGDWGAKLSKLIPEVNAAPTKELVKTGKDAKAVKVANNILNTSVKKLYAQAKDEAASTKEGADLDLVGLYLSDLADHLEAACVIYAYDGTPAAARKVFKATDLDTASREMFSDTAWTWIQKATE